MRVRRLVRTMRTIAIACSCSASFSSIAAAQRTAQVSVNVGSATDERGVRSNALAIAPSVTLRPGTHLVITLGANATRFETAAWTAGVSTAVAARTGEVVGAAFSLSGGAGLTRSSYGATFAVADATPALEWSVGALTFFGGARIASGVTRMQASSRQLPLPGQSTLVASRRTSLGPVFGGQWRVLGDGAAWPMTASYREERGTSGGVSIEDRSLGIVASVGNISLAASAGQRVAPSVHMQFASATASVALAQSLSLNVSAGRYPSDRVTGSAAGRFASAGLSVHFGGARAPRLPAPRDTRPPGDGMTRLSIRAEQAHTVEVFGDWNDWMPTAARRAVNGVWYVDVSLAPGEYRYAFRVDQTDWRVPIGAVTADDGFGGKSAYVTVVRGPAKQATRSQENR